MSLAVVHVAQSAGSAAGRAALRSHRACRAAGLRSSCVVLDGPAVGDCVLLRMAGAPDPLGLALSRTIDAALGVAGRERLSFAHPAMALDRHPLFLTTDAIHLHGALPGLAPAALRRWLDAGRRVVWSLHDAWPMTGGCHDPGDCVQWRTACMKCPLFADHWSLVPNAFAEKRAAYADPRLLLVAPTAAMATRAAESAIPGHATIHAVPDAVDTAVFRERPERAALRRGFGIAPQDFVVLLGDGAEPPGTEWPSLVAALAPANLVMLALGGAPAPAVDGARVMPFGDVAEDAVRADILTIADLALWPMAGAGDRVSETLAVGTPCLVAEGDAAAQAGTIVAREGAIRDVALGHEREALRQRAAQGVRDKQAPETIGSRLAAIYAACVVPSAEAEMDGALAARIAHALAAAPLEAESTPGRAFLQFPLNRLLAREAGAAQAGLALESAPPRRLLAVRSHHAHHAASSGPYHFLRHLPAGFDPESWTVPLGHDLAPQAVNAMAGLGRLIGARSFGHNTNSWEAEAELLLRCAASAVDLVHFIDGEHGGWLLPQLPASLFAGGRLPRFVATFHQPPALLLGLVNRAVLRRFDAVIVLCQSMRQAFAGMVAPERLHVVPHGVDTDFFSPGPARAPDGVFRLLAVGHWLRDYPTALRALAALRARGVDARLTIVWKDFSAELPPGVEVVHGLSDQDLRAAYRHCDALFLPLTDATANNAILEAMACGRPVVSTDVGGVREATGDAALLCPAGDAEALAEALALLAGDPARCAALGAAARARAEALDWRHVAARHAAIYDAVLDAAPGEAAA